MVQKDNLRAKIEVKNPEESIRDLVGVCKGIDEVNQTTLR